MQSMRRIPTEQGLPDSIHVLRDINFESFIIDKGASPAWSDPRVSEVTKWRVLQGVLYACATGDLSIVNDRVWVDEEEITGRERGHV